MTLPLALRRQFTLVASFAKSTGRGVPPDPSISLLIKNIAQGNCESLGKTPTERGHTHG